MALAVYTGRLGTYRGADGLDITLKSSRGLGRAFAPTEWGMVLGVKRGQVSEAQYREWYSLSHYDYNIKHRIYVEFNDCLMAI